MGKKTGFGEIHYKNGCKYTGDFRDNLIEGEGTYTWSDG